MYLSAKAAIKDANEAFKAIRADLDKSGCELLAEMSEDDPRVEEAIKEYYAAQPNVLKTANAYAGKPLATADSRGKILETLARSVDEHANSKVDEGRGDEEI